MARMDISLNYREQGCGEPLILLHGNGEDSSYFVHQLEYFSRWYRVIALDTRGHGGSPRGEGPFSIRRFARDLLDFMDGMEIPAAHLLGFSDGANIALCFALAHPERVKLLILNGGNLDSSGVKRSVQLPIEIGYRIARLFAGFSDKAGKNAEMLGLMVNDPNIAPEKLQTLSMPTLVIAGTKDMIRDEHTRLIAEKIPRSRLVLLPGDHFIANKKPMDFNAAVERFLWDMDSDS